MALTTEKKPLDSLYKAVSSQIKINGQLLDSDFEINKIITFKEINKLSRARIQILGGDYTKNTFNESENKIFDPGNEVEIKFGYDQKLTLIFEGIILKFSPALSKIFFLILELLASIISFFALNVFFFDNNTNNLFCNKI